LEFTESKVAGLSQKTDL